VLGGNHSPGLTRPGLLGPVRFVTPLREQGEH
jgi:hypothetical protein